MLRSALLLATLLLFPSVASASASLVARGDRTYLVEDGAVSGSRAGIWAATSRGLVELRIDRISVPLSDCSQEPWVPLADVGAADTLLAIEEDGTRTELAGFHDGAGLEHESSITIQAILGAFVFAYEDSFDDFCGAHGSGARTMIVYDLETQSAIDLVGDPRLSGWRTSLEPDARAEYVRWGGWPIDDLDIHLVGILPRFAGSELPEVSAVFAAFTCYACADTDDESAGTWGSYYSAANIPARLPALFRAAASATWPARRVIGSQSGAPIFGASAIPSDLAARLRTSFCA